MCIYIYIHTTYIYIYTHIHIFGELFIHSHKAPCPCKFEYNSCYILLLALPAETPPDRLGSGCRARSLHGRLPKSRPRSNQELVKDEENIGSRSLRVEGVEFEIPFNGLQVLLSRFSRRSMDGGVGVQLVFERFIFMDFCKTPEALSGAKSMSQVHGLFGLGSACSAPYRGF